MKSMSATFNCQGYVSRIETTEAEIGPVEVTLETDGTAVLVRESMRGSAPPLTPDGWLELAGHARRLVDDANAAWKAMGAMPDA